MTIEQIKALSSAEINRIIAEWVGWRVKGKAEVFILMSPDGVRRSVLKQYGIDHVWSLVPNYCEDLNAVHGVEMKLERKDLYLSRLRAMNGFRPFEHWPDELWSKVVCATARQRAEALVWVICRKPTFGNLICEKET